MPWRLGVILACLACGIISLVAGAAPLRVGIDLDGEPMMSVDAKGVPRGFAVEIVNSIAAEMHIEVVYVAKPWAEMLEDFKAGRTDALANIPYTQERAAIMEFTVPHVVLAGAVFVRKGDTSIRKLADLRDCRVSVKPGGSPHEYLMVHGWAEHIVPSSKLRDGMRLVAEGRADATLDARIVGMKYIRDEHLDNIEVANIDVFDFAQRLHIAFHRGDAEHVELFNEGLARLHANGTYDRIYEKWIDPLEPRSLRWRQLQPYLAPAVVVLLAILGALVWQRRLLLRLARSAEALRLGEERLTLVLEGSEDGFWDWDLRTGRVERSERWAAMLGYTLAEIAPTFDAGLELVHPDDRPRCEILRSTPSAADAVRYNIEYRMRTKSGDWRWILDRSKIVARAPDGAPLRIAGTHSDITDLKRAEAALSRKEAQFRFIYEHAPVGLSWMQRGHAETRLVNAAHQVITGISAARSREAGIYIASTHPEDRERQRVLQERLSRGEIDHLLMEKRFVHADGSIVWAMLSMHLFRDPVTGEEQEVSTLVDISELKRAEAERENLRLKMLETQKLESLGVLAGGIAHDFNNLLTVILANASFIRADPADAAAREEHLSLIESASRRAADLCRQMLAYAGKGSFVIEHVDLSRLVRDTTHLLHVSINKNARLVFALAPDLPPVEADASQLQQVVMNLVINASDALADGPGEIRLTTRRGRPAPTATSVVHSFELPLRECVCVEVADTGHGMDADTLTRIFDPFFTTKFTGRGLGLAAVLGIVRALHGALVVESARERGTTFQLFLPVSETQVRVAPARSNKIESALAPQPSSSRGTLLVADDEPSVLATTGALLRRAGFSTILVPNGDEALRHFRANPRGFAGIVLDLTMPGLDGAQVLREIRALNASVRVLVMSGFTEQDVFNRLRGLGSVVSLHKPFGVESLLARVEETVGG